MNQRPSPRQLADARAVIRADKLARKANRGQRVKHTAARPASADDGSDYMAWLHEGIPCIACAVMGQTLPLGLNGIEAAHQKLQCADRNWNRKAGRRGSHWTCVPLCRLHHREGPLRCDPAQAKFWSVIGLSVEEVIDFAEALNAAFRNGASGLAVVGRFANLAAFNRVRREPADNQLIGRGI